MAEKEIYQLVEEGFNVENGELDLREQELKDEDIITLAKTEKLKNVTALFLEFNEIGDEGVKALTESLYLKNLKTLSSNIALQININFTTKRTNALRIFHTRMRIPLNR